MKVRPFSKMLTMKYLIAFVQIFDSAIHIFINQIEPLRLATSVLILVWLFIIKTHRYDWGIVGCYVFANSLFIIQNGVLNEGVPRIFFLIAVTSTSLLLWKLISTRKKSPSN